jgi:hypothetical protein
VTQNSDSSFSTVTSQRFCVTNRASTGDDGDGRYFYLCHRHQFGGRIRFKNNDFIILVTMVTMVTQISLPLAGGRRKERTMVNFLMVTDYDTRQKPSEVRWHGNIGYITIDGTLWGEVEWSKTRKAWCIQDAQGRCLSHTDHIHASEADKEAAIALAKAMIRDGRMPDPRTAMQIRARREKGLNREQNLKQVKRSLDWLGF